MSARANRRTALRHARRLKVPCSMKHVSEGEPFEAKAAIVTASAVRLFVPRALAAQAYVTVELPDDRGRHVGHLFRVALARPQGEHVWTVDGRFTKPLEPGTLRAAQAALSSSRSKLGWRTRCRLVQVRHEGPWLATMQNVSRSGLGMILDRPFDPGTFLEISLPSIRRKHLQPKVVRVTHARPLPDSPDWLLGAAFLRALTDEELQVLL